MAKKITMKNRISEHWLFACWVIVVALLPYVVYGPYMHIVSIVPKVISVIIVIGMVYIIYKNDPDLDRWKWICAIGIVLMFIWIMLQASQYKQDRLEGIVP